MTTARVIRPECDVAIVRQHTQVQTWVDGNGELLGMQIVGDRSIVVLGLTSAGADMLIRHITAGLNDLHSARVNLARLPSAQHVEAGGQ